MAWPVRYNIIGLLFVSTAVNYIDRVNISVAAPVIMKETGWDKGQFGLVFSAFLIGYANYLGHVMFSPSRLNFPLPIADCSMWNIWSPEKCSVLD